MQRQEREEPAIRLGLLIADREQRTCKERSRPCLEASLLAGGALHPKDQLECWATFSIRSERRTETVKELRDDKGQESGRARLRLRAADARQRAERLRKAKL